MYNHATTTTDAAVATAINNRTQAESNKKKKKKNHEKYCKQIDKQKSYQYHGMVAIPDLLYCS